jgi:GDSL-like Lipase/Acylhydrolase
MIAIKKSLFVKICVAFTALSSSLVIGYALYGLFRKTPEPVIFTGPKDEYMFSFYNQKGEKLSELDGMLKFMTDPFTVYKNYPNQKTGKYSINESGFRDSYNSDNPHTAIALGGSAAFGFALNNSNMTFSSKINRSSKKYNVLNAAVTGFLSGQELSQMVHYLDDFNPSLYIVFDGWNDIYDPYAFTKSWPVMSGPIGYNNAFFMIESRLAQYFQMTRKDKHSQASLLEPVGQPLNEENYFQKILETYVSNISKMHSFAHSRGAGFLIVFQPELGNKKMRSDAEQETLTTWADKYEYFARKIPERYKRLINGARQFCQERSIAFIDINAEATFSENPQTLFFDVVHPNELGHEVIANIISQTLSEKF